MFLIDFALIESDFRASKWLKSIKFREKSLEFPRRVLFWSESEIKIRSRIIKSSGIDWARCVDTPRDRWHKGFGGLSAVLRGLYRGNQRSLALSNLHEKVSVQKYHQVRNFCDSFKLTDL